MRVERIDWMAQPVAFPCFRCQKSYAENRVVLDIGDGGTLMVCLCEECTGIPELELVTHFMERNNAKRNS